MAQQHGLRRISPVIPFTVEYQGARFDLRGDTQRRACLQSLETAAGLAIEWGVHFIDAAPSIAAEQGRQAIGPRYQDKAGGIADPVRDAMGECS